MLEHQSQRVGVCLVGDLALLVVAQPLGLLRQRVVVGAHLMRCGGAAHAPLEHHRAGDRRRPLEVVGGAVGDASEHHLLGRAAAQRDLQPILQLVLGEHVAVLLGQAHHEAERATAGDDRDLVDVVRHQPREQRVAGLVVGDHPLLLVGDQLSLLQPGHHPLDRRVEVERHDLLGPGAAGLDRCLVAYVGQVGAGQARPSAARSRRRSTLSARGLLRVCTSRISARPLQVGRGRRGSGGRSGRAEAGPGRGRRAGWTRP